MAGTKRNDREASQSRDLRQNSYGVLLLLPAPQLALHPLACTGRAQWSVDESYRLQHEHNCVQAHFPSLCKLQDSLHELYNPGLSAELLCTTAC
jgi:hypothetical protein